MTARRTALTVLTSGLALIALSGCQKPTPAVTLAVGGNSVRAEADLYCRAGQSIAKNDCVTHAGRPQVLRARQGAQIGVDVDRVLSKHGWYLVDADAKQRSPVQDIHYFTFNADFSNRPTKGVINLEIRSVDHVAENATPTGAWKFQLLEK